MQQAAKSTLEKIVRPDNINTAWSAIKPFIVEKKYHSELIEELKKVFNSWEKPRSMEILKTYNNLYRFTTKIKSNRIYKK